jgi:signal transduction histidine kinase
LDGKEMNYSGVISGGDSPPAAVWQRAASGPVGAPDLKPVRLERPTFAFAAARVTSVAALFDLLMSGARERVALCGGGLLLRTPGAPGFVLAAAAVPEGWGWHLPAEVPAGSPAAARLLETDQAFTSPLPPEIESWLGGGRDQPALAWLPTGFTEGAQGWLVLAVSPAGAFGSELVRQLEEWALQAGLVLARLHAETQAVQARSGEREARELRSRFLALVSHEFRSPLTAAAAAAEVLQQHFSQLPAERRDDLFEAITTSLQRLGTMLEELLAIGRADSGREVFAPVPLDLGDLLRACVEEARHADRDRHPFTVRCGETPFPARADPRLLRHILGNLLSNATLYSAPGRPVEVTLEREQGDVVIKIRDQGRGIPPEDGERIMEPFERGSNVRDQPGTGLGLEIARRLVGLHGARLAWTSDVGQGTTFEVRWREGATDGTRPPP